MSIINTSVDDMRSSLRCSWAHYTAEDLQRELEKERQGQKRASVIKVLESAIKRKRKESIS